jgi:hypothetical protein
MIQLGYKLCSARSSRVLSGAFSAAPYRVVCEENGVTLLHMMVCHSCFKQAPALACIRKPFHSLGRPVIKADTGSTLRSAKTGSYTNIGNRRNSDPPESASLSHYRRRARWKRRRIVRAATCHLIRHNNFAGVLRLSGCALAMFPLAVATACKAAQITYRRGARRWASGGVPREYVVTRRLRARRI